jgi:hypothetical protein
MMAVAEVMAEAQEEATVVVVMEATMAMVEDIMAEGMVEGIIVAAIMGITMAIMDGTGGQDHFGIGVCLTITRQPIIIPTIIPPQTIITIPRQPIIIHLPHQIIIIPHRVNRRRVM